MLDKKGTKPLSRICFAQMRRRRAPPREYAAEWAETFGDILLCPHLGLDRVSYASERNSRKRFPEAGAHPSIRRMRFRESQTVENAPTRTQKSYVLSQNFR